jgi:hypothetical protein
MKGENIPQAESLTKSHLTETQPGYSSDPGVVRRRSFLKGLGIVGATLLPAGALLLPKAKAQERTSGGRLSKGDADLLRFAA